MMCRFVGCSLESFFVQLVLGFGFFFPIGLKCVLFFILDHRQKC